MADLSFGEWLKRQRKTLGLTQEQLALQINCSTSALRKIEADERRASVQTTGLIAKAFNIFPSERAAFQKFARGEWKSASGKFLDEAPWRNPSTPRLNIPSPATSLIGREQEISDVCEYLLKADIRLVTLIGPPGIGKTRLSLEAAHESLSNFPDGVFFVPLATLDDPVFVAPAIVQILGYVETSKHSAIDQVIDDIGDKKMLLVLDNFEHLMDDAAPLASRLLSGCPHLKIMITSREALRIPGEWLYSVPTLLIPEENSIVDMETSSKFPALTLFAERAHAVRSDFALNPDNIQFVASICAQLDGLPLAIELIAARIRLMSPQALLERLTYQFILSADGMQAFPARQKTLQNAIGWSYNLLSLEDQKLFAYLSVFAGGFTLDAIESMFSKSFTDTSVPDLIGSLLDKSLIQRTANKHGEIRFDMLVTIQQFALDCLRRMDLESDVRDMHLAYFIDLAEKADKGIHGANQIEWSDRLESDHENFLVVLEWCLKNQKTESALRLLGMLCWPWDVRNHYIAMRNWFDRVRLFPDITSYPATYATLLNHVAQNYWMTGDFRDAQSALEESQVIWLKLGIEGELGLANALDWLGMVARWSKGDSDVAYHLFVQSFELYKKHADQWGMAMTIFHLAIIEEGRNQTASALSLFEQSFTQLSKLGDLWGIARVSQLLGQLFLKQGIYEKARQFFEQHLTIDERLHFREGIVVALRNLGNLYRYQGDFVQAEQFYERSLMTCREYGFKDDISKNLYFLGLLALHRNDYPQAWQRFTDFFELARTVYEKISARDLFIGLAAIAGGTNQPERAATLFGAAQEVLDVNDNRFSSFDGAEFDRHIQMARDQLGNERFESLQDEGRAMALADAVAYAIENKTAKNPITY